MTYTLHDRNGLIVPKATEAVPRHRKRMNRYLVAVAAVIAFAGAAHAASAVNRDAETRTLIVTEGGVRSELSLAAGETVEFCNAGCFVTLPNGDREALTGTETLEIRGGAGHIK